MLKIQFLNGGLANQAFQYIFARHFELSHPGEIMYMDDSYFALNTVHNGYELEKVFGIKPHMLSEAFDADVWEYMLEQKKQGKSIPQILKDNGIDIDMITEHKDMYERFNPFNGNVFEGKYNEYDPTVQCFERNTYFHGYWLNSGWFEAFKPQFLEEFRFPVIPDEYNRNLMIRILNEKSASIHVRRGDFADLNVAYGADLYKEMIDACLENGGGDAVLYVFSDDIKWCRQNCEDMGLNRFKELVYVEGNTGEKSYIDMQLMKNCDIMMVGNSSFAFLAALLNQRKRFIVNYSGRKI